MKKYNFQSELVKERQKIEKAHQLRLEQEMTKIKEILDQEFEYKVNQLEQKFERKQKEL